MSLIVTAKTPEVPETPEESDGSTNTATDNPSGGSMPGSLLLLCLSLVAIRVKKLTNNS